MRNPDKIAFISLWETMGKQGKGSKLLELHLCFSLKI